MMDTQSVLLHGPKIVTETEVLSDHAIEIRDGVITGLLALDADLPTDIPHCALPADHFLVPGLIDCHIHGANGADVMDADPDALQVMAEALLKKGTTQFFATTMTAPSGEISQALKAVAQFRRQSQQGAARIAGVHLEGPFLSPKRPGAQCAQHLSQPDWEKFQQWQQDAEGAIKLVTVAPELDDACQFIKQCHHHEVVASIGHTAASCAQAQAGIDAGATHATHLFNAMTGVHHREPGAATAILMDKRVAAELIVDFVHVHPDSVRFAVETKGADKIILVTDAMRAQCLGDGRFELGGQKVTVQQGEARLDNGVLAGSVLTLDQALRNMRQGDIASLCDMVNMASLNPAKSMGISGYHGSIAVGKMADLVLLDGAWNVVSVLQSWSENEGC